MAHPVSCISGDAGVYKARLPLLLNGEVTCPYRYLSIEGVVRRPSLVFTQPSVILAAVPLNVKITRQITTTPVDYPR